MSSHLPITDQPPARRNVYVVGGSDHYANWMEATAIVNRMEDADLVMFTGGEDISVSLYGEPAHESTYSNPARDRREVLEYQKAIKLGIPCWGTCRGAQITCVMSGGKLVQDQDNPRYLHSMDTIGGQVITVSSTHHQSAFPWFLPKDHYSVIGWTKGISPYHSGGHGEEMVLTPERLALTDGGKEVEICHYPKIRAIGCQSHPEMLYGQPDAAPMIAYMRGLLNRHLATGGLSAT